MTHENAAPGAPGIPPTWCASVKDVVTTSLGSSRVWVTLGSGIVNEVYWPSTGQPQVRDLGFIVARPGRWFELKELDSYDVRTPKPFIPLPTIVHRGEDFTLELEVVADDNRDVVLVRYRLEGEGYRLYPLLTPRLGMEGRGNTAWIEEGAFYAEHEFYALSLRCDRGFARGSVGYVGRSDGWQDFHLHGEMTWTYDRAENGNVALIGELTEPQGVLALGFSSTPEGTETLSRSSLAEGFQCIRDRVQESWNTWGKQLKCPKRAKRNVRPLMYRSAMVLKVCEDRHYPGAVVASLSIPWGFSRNDLGGYHLVWPRDAVQTGFAMLAARHHAEARRMAAYLIATQHADGRWSQNYFPDGRPYWTNIQLDEIGFPILLLAKLQESGHLGELQGVEQMARRAAGFLVRTGPVSPQDRWEENSGLSPFTVAVQVAALVAAAPFLPNRHERKYALSYADYLNRRIEDWMYVAGTPLAEKHGVDGYYVRLATPEIFNGRHGEIRIANRQGWHKPVEEVVSLDYLYLSRLGLRRPDCEWMTNTLKVAEGELKVETPCGPSFYRYNGDGYGEHADGSPYDGTGIGRLWPLLTGERGHFAVQLGEDPAKYLQAMAAMTSPGGLLPEQVWDAEPVPEMHLYPGKPTGSAMPLLWAHAEFMKLLSGCEEGRPIELLDAVESRYHFERPEPKTWHWRADVPFDTVPAGVDVLIEAGDSFRLHFGYDGWQEVEDREAALLGFGMYGVRLTAADLRQHQEVNLTFYDPDRKRWEGHDHRIRIESK